MPRRRLVVMAKAPVAGAVKTRLSPPLAPAFAAALAAAFLRDELAAFSRLPHREAWLCYSPAAAREQMLPLAEGLPVSLQPQADGDLGTRLLRVFDETGLPTVVVGGDSPDLSPERLEAAFRLLEEGEAEVVLGPADDGGYYLIAARGPHPELFRDIPWSGPEVLALTLSRAAAAGLRVRLLPPWRDVDTPDDLRALRERLAHAAPEVATHTRAVLAELDG
ncbi:MAG: TIGR04282 family arsenosugar biosynthesis glycosyltransferase [Armatimonadota bacterium]